MKLFNNDNEKNNEKVEKMKFWGNVLGFFKGGMNLAAAVLNFINK